MTVLQAAPDAPVLLRFGADALLVLHIGGGTLGMLSGAAALLARKGGRLHRIAGSVFVVSMLTAMAVGAGVAPFLSDGQRPNFVAGIMGFYLVATAWLTVRRKAAGAGAVEAAGLVAALAVATAGVVFIVQAQGSPTGTIDGSPPQAFYVFLILGTFAAAGDLNLILRKGLTGPPRIARHLWRMCVGLFIATGSFFLGQQKVMPEFIQGSPWLYLPVVAPILLMAFWLVRVRLAGWRMRLARAEPALR